MSEVEALLEIAKALNELASKFEYVGIILFLMFLFKKMG